MIPFLADQNFDMSIARGIWRLFPEIEILHVSEIGLSIADDAEILDWAATHGYCLLTHDARTMPAHAFDRLSRDLPLNGVFIIPVSLPIRQVIEEFSIILHCSSKEDWIGQVTRLPL